MVELEGADEGSFFPMVVPLTIGRWSLHDSLTDQRFLLSDLLHNIAVQLEQKSFVPSHLSTCHLASLRHSF